MNKYLVNILIGAFCWSGMSACASPKDEAKEIVDIIYPKSVIRISLCRTAKRNPLIFPI